ncbi:MAG: hypothetical protein AAFZ49_18720 [Cyanobacteria bacterium J06659_2]
MAQTLHRRSPRQKTEQTNERHPQKIRIVLGAVLLQGISCHQ